MQPPEPLTPDERDGLTRGEHESVASAAAARGAHRAAGWILEQIWDFEGAYGHYRDGQDRLGALRTALESRKQPLVQECLAAFEQAAAERRCDEGELDTAVQMLRRHRRDMEAARLLAAKGEGPQARAQALLRGGDRVAAATVLAEAGHAREALDALIGDGRTPMRAHGLAARLSWDLGDAEGAARHAQAALRSGVDDDATRSLLARALGSLGHDLAAQMVVGDAGVPDEAPLPGRYHVTGTLPAPYAGNAYVGIDRVTLQEVELHLLLAEHPGTAAGDQARKALDRFASDARAAAALGHPAIRSVTRISPADGLLVMPRAEGESLRRLIRPPGMLEAPARARAMIAFLLEGLAAGHAHGLVHGSLLPSQIVSDALGRPLVGPFGAHHLLGLAATRTGALEELMSVTAPEVRAGATPTLHSDVFAAGALFAALLCGTLEPPAPDLDSAELALARRMMAPSPGDRAPLEEALERLREPIADLRDAAVGPAAAAGRAATGEGLGELTRGALEVDPAPSWEAEVLDELCRVDSPWLQPILDRNGRVLTLAPWPPGCRSLEDATEGWQGLLPPAVLDRLPEILRAAVTRRLAPSSLVATPSGEWMLALDDLLRR